MKFQNYGNYKLYIIYYIFYNPIKILKKEFLFVKKKNINLNSNKKINIIV
jgi:hypothetical protein